MSQSLLLDLVNWDLCVTATGNIAVCSQPYSDAQDAACAIKLFSGELYYSTLQGVPYWSQILGKIPPNALFKAKMKAAALSATNVTTATVGVTSFQNRQVGGIVVVTNNQSQTASTTWAVPLGVGSV